VILEYSIMQSIIDYLLKQADQLNILFLFAGIILSSLMGLITVLIASLNNFRFLRDANHVAVGSLLPPVGFVIVYVIGSNLALSLGMIGALSIIRFRNPVRSSYELLIYFLLLTIGISMKVNIFVSLALVLFANTIFIFLYLIKNYKKTNILDNTDDNTFLLLGEVEDSGTIKEELMKIENLEQISKNSEKNNILSFTLSFKLKKDLEIFLNTWKKELISYEAQINNKN